MTYWSTSQSRLLSEAEFIAAIGQSVQAVAPPGASRREDLFRFRRNRHPLHTDLLRAGTADPGPGAAGCTGTGQRSAGRALSGRARCGADPWRSHSSAAPPVVRYDHGEMGPIDPGLIFDPDSYRDDLLRFPRTAPQWLIDYVGGIPLAQLLSGTYFPFPGPGSVPSHATDAGVGRGHRARLHPCAPGGLRRAQSVFPDRTTYSGRLAGVHPGAGRPVPRRWSDAVDLPGRRRRCCRDSHAGNDSRRKRAGVHPAGVPARASGEPGCRRPRPRCSTAVLRSPARGEPESTADVPGAREAQTARDNLWRSVGQVYEPLLAPLDADGVLWPGGTRAYRAVRRDRTTLIATDGMSAPSLTGGGTSTVYGPVPGGSMLGVGAEFFLESVDPGLRADESAREHWLFGLLSAVAERAATDGSDFVALDHGRTRGGVRGTARASRARGSGW